jgi:peptidoglycan/xylan/chitin deacetylase (PgdA/CDA1 family)
MTGNGGLGVRVRRVAAVWFGLAVLLSASATFAAGCPRPDALGTSRTLVVEAKAHPLIGTMQYRETLPLNDGEVVLTFDDGPLPKHSNQILDILAAQCVKATFFMVGRQAQANPEGVRKVRDAGHTVATHTQSHPSGMHRLSIERAKAEIDDGIANVTAALGDGGAAVMSPFFRIPGLARNDAIEEYTRALGLQIWSADFPADDWRHVSSARVYDLALSRLAAKGKGILLLHDIQARTVAALPKILHELKVRGYRIVHVVPATPGLSATPSEPQQWLMHPSAEAVAALRWPKIPSFVFAQQEPLPAPLLTDSYWNDLAVLGEPQRRRGVPLPKPAIWPKQIELASIDTTSVLPAPSAVLFDPVEGLRAAPPVTAAVVHREEPPVVAQAKAERPVKRVAGRHTRLARVAAVAPAKRAVVARVKPSRVAPPVAARTATKRVVPDKKNVKRAVRHHQEASL